MSNFNPREGKCDGCGERRSLHDGLCHECESQIESEAVCVECNKGNGSCECVGGPWIPGGYRL